jgi:hypothetical protein
VPATISAVCDKSAQQERQADMTGDMTDASSPPRMSWEGPGHLTDVGGPMLRVISHHQGVNYLQLHDNLHSLAP